MGHLINMNRNGKTGSSSTLYFDHEPFYQPQFFPSFAMRPQLQKTSIYLLNIPRLFQEAAHSTNCQILSAPHLLHILPLLHTTNSITDTQFVQLWQIINHWNVNTQNQLLEASWSMEATHGTLAAYSLNNLNHVKFSNIQTVSMAQRWRPWKAH